MQRKLRFELEEINRITDQREKIRQWTALAPAKLISLDDILPFISPRYSVSVPLEEHLVITNGHESMKAQLVPAYAVALYEDLFPPTPKEREESYRSLSYIALEQVLLAQTALISDQQLEYTNHTLKIKKIEESEPHLPEQKQGEQDEMYQDRIKFLESQFFQEKKLSLQARQKRQRNAIVRLHGLEQLVDGRVIDDAVSSLIKADYTILQSWFEGRNKFTHPLLRLMTVPSLQPLKEYPFEFYASLQLPVTDAPVPKTKLFGRNYLGPVLTSLAIAAMIWKSSPPVKTSIQFPANSLISTKQEFVTALQSEPPFVLDHYVKLPNIDLPKKIQLASRDLTITHIDENGISIHSPATVMTKDQFFRDCISQGLYLVRSPVISKTMGEFLRNQYFLAIDASLYGGQLNASQISYRLTPVARELIKEYFREETVRVSFSPNLERTLDDLVYSLSDDSPLIDGGKIIANIIGTMKDGVEHRIEIEFSLEPPIQSSIPPPDWSYPPIRKELKIVRSMIEKEMKRLPPVSIKTQVNLKSIPLVHLPVSYIIDGEKITLEIGTVLTVPSRKFHDYTPKEGESSLRAIELISNTPVGSINDLVSRTIVISSKNKVVRAAPLSLSFFSYSLDPVYEKAIAALSSPVSVNIRTLHGERSTPFIPGHFYTLREDELVHTLPSGWVIPHRMKVHLKQDYPQLGITLLDSEINSPHYSVYEIPLPWASKLPSAKEK